MEELLKNRQIKLKYIITGTGRCGTLFAANFLSSAGFPCSHEGIFTPKGLNFAKLVIEGKEQSSNSKISQKSILVEFSPDILAESSYMSAPFLSNFDSCQIIHLIRNPIDVVSSFLAFNYFSNSYPSNDKNGIGIKVYEEFIYSHIPELKQEMSQVDRACLYWICWNELIENSKKVDYIHRIEDSTKGLSNFLNCEGNHSKVENSFWGSKPNFELSDIENKLIKKRLIELAKKYGYLKNLAFIL